MQWENWSGWLGWAASAVLAFVAWKKQSSDDRSESFKELEALKNDYKDRLEKVERQQVDNTIKINQLMLQERDCQKTVGVLNDRVNHLSKQNDQLLDILKTYDFRKSGPENGTRSGLLG